MSDFKFDNFLPSFPHLLYSPVDIVRWNCILVRHLSSGSFVTMTFQVIQFHWNVPNHSNSPSSLDIFFFYLFNLCQISQRLFQCHIFSISNTPGILCNWKRSHKVSKSRFSIHFTDFIFRTTASSSMLYYGGVANPFSYSNFLLSKIITNSTESEECTYPTYMCK